MPYAPRVGYSVALVARTSMHDLPSGDDGPVRERPTDRNIDPDPVWELTGVVVGYEDRADRRTIFPADCRDDRLLTTWLSANADAFVDLEGCR